MIRSSDMKEFFGLYKWKHIGMKTKVIRPMRILGEENMSLGDNVRIFNEARLEVIRKWQDIELGGELIIGDNTSIEQRVHIVAADKLEIGHDVVISANVYISDCAHHYKINSNAMSNPLCVKQTKIGNYVFIGYGVCIMPGVTIGDNVVIGANSVVTHDCEPNCIYAGVPARLIKRAE